MKVEVIMPKMGESLQEGTILKWFKNVGDPVDRDEMILEISTDKVDTEVPSPVKGILAEILANVNETIEVGKVIAYIETDANAKPTTTKKTDEIKEDKTVNTQNQTNELTANTNENAQIPARLGDKFFSPLVRTIAEQENVTLDELQKIDGSGTNGRVTKDDILKYIDNRSKSSNNISTIAQSSQIQPAAKESKQEIAAPVMNYGDDVEIIPMDRVRSIIAQNMVKSIQTSPHVTSVMEADITEIVKYRNKNKKSFEQSEGIKLTFTPFFVKAAAEAIKQFPGINVSVDGTNIVKHKKINIGIATALEDGNLIVPVIKNTNQLNLSGLAHQVTDLSGRARNKKLSPDDIQGGTFTITNLGTFGTLFGTPIINQPQTAIMGIGVIQKRPIVKEFNGEYIIMIRDMVYVSLTYDHRVIDGQLGGQCLAAIVKSLESMNETTIL